MSYEGDVESEGVSEFERGRGDAKVPMRTRRGFEMSRKIFAYLSAEDKADIFGRVDGRGLMAHHYAAMTGNIQLLKVRERRERGEREKGRGERK